MSHGIRFASSLVIATLAPLAAHAGDVTLSDVSLTARATFSSQRVMPELSDFDTKTAPADELPSSGASAGQGGPSLPQSCPTARTPDSRPRRRRSAACSASA